MSAQKNEFSRMIDTRKLNTIPKEYNIIPTLQDLEKLAQRFHFHTLTGIESTLSLSKKGSRIFIEGFVKGACQLDAFSIETPLYEEIKVLLFTDKTARDFDPSRIEGDIYDSWDCDVLEDGSETLDIGEIIAQYISLSTVGADLNPGTQGRVIELF
jgi:hypothetical protein